MAVQPCWRCLQRLTLSSRYTPSAFSATAPFSTSAYHLKNPPSPAAKGSKSSQKLRVKAPRLGGKRKTTKSTGKPPAEGERKAIRKRVVLSNTNALEIDGLTDWSKGNYADPQLLGRMVGLPGPVVDSLRAIESFQHTQGWGMFKRPSTLIRNETMEIAKHVQECTEADNPSTRRRIIVGERGSGKSVLLLQAQAVALQAGWVVFHFPEGQDLTAATTAYAPLPDTKPTKYMQADYTAALLSRVAKANQAVLSSLKLTQEHDLPVPLKPKMSLYLLAEMGGQDSTIAWAIYKALWAELTSTSARRPPVLLTLDGLAHVSRLSNYLTPSMYNIHAYDLAILDHFMSHLSGSLTLPNGGAVLAADSMSNRPDAPSFDLAIRQREADAAGAPKMPLHDTLRPYDKHDPRVLELVRLVDVTRVPGLSRAEARTILEHFAKSGLLRAPVTEQLVAEKWTIAGRGLVGEMERNIITGQMA